MTVTDQIKILDRKIMQNEKQHDLDRKAAEIYVLPSNNLDKYEHLTGEHLGLKPSTVEQVNLNTLRCLIQGEIGINGGEGLEKFKKPNRWRGWNRSGDWKMMENVINRGLGV